MTGCFLLASWLAAPAQALPSFADVRAAWRPSEAWLLDRHGQPLQVQRLDRQARRLDWTPLAKMSPALIAAVKLSEDRRFDRHAGVDWPALGGAALASLTGGRRGASTLTMQLAGLIDPGLQAGPDGRSVLQKIGQIGAAQAIEGQWRKVDIIEAYLNLAPFRGEAQGIAAASQLLFAKAPHGLNQGEAIITAALLRGPNAKVDLVARRACELAEALRARVSCDYLQGLAAQALSSTYAASKDLAEAPEAALRLLKRPGERVRSTLDGATQRKAREILRRQLASLRERNVNDGAMLVLDNASGEVLAYVGNTGADSSARFVDAVLARRQAGSTLKPFLYELALERRLITAASLLEDSPVNLETPTGLYVPQNYDKDFKGIISARVSLASSLNVPAVRTLLLTGIEPFFQRLQALGFGLPETGDYYGYSLALGSADVTLWQLSNAYRTLANQGRWSPARLQVGKAPSRPTLNQAASYVVSDILSDRVARSRTFGLENPLSTRFWSAVKTGTSKDMRDNWCIGFSRRYTVGVWVGNMNGEPMWDVSGVTGAAPAWLDMLNWLQRDQNSRPPTAPSGLVASTVFFDGLSEPGRREWFLAGTEQTRVALASQPSGKIIYPGNGEIIALDPDIPLSRQKVWFEISGRGRLLLDGLPMAVAGDALKWTPQPGRHVLALVGKTGREMDRVVFEVRGRWEAQR